MLKGGGRLCLLIMNITTPLWSSPSLNNIFISHKYMSEERNFSRVLQESNITPAKIMDLFRNLRGPFKNIPVRKMDVSNVEVLQDNEYM
jgi:hypothetical protein